MVRIISNNEIERTQWRALVQSAATGTWFQSPEAYDFFALQPELFIPFAFGVYSNNHLRGVCCGYITIENSLIKQYYTRRAIIIGGPCLANDATDEEVFALMDAVRQNLKSKAIYVESRNFNDYSKWRLAFEAAGFEYVPHLDYHIDTSSVDVVEANLGKSRKRDMRTSFREGAFIIEKPTIEQVREYYAILAELYRTKIKLPLFPLSFFEALYHHPDGRFLLVGLPQENGGVEIIGGTACVVQEGKCVYEWFACGRDGKWKSIFPSSVATYAGIRYAAENGCSRFDMMGAGKPDESYGVRDFKAKFGGKEVEYGRFMAINSPLLYRIGAFSVSLMQRESWLPSAEQKSKEQMPGKKEWSQFVAHHPQGTIFQTPEMYAVYEQTKHQEPIVVYAKRDGKIKGMLLAVIQWNGGELAKPLTARSIIIGGPLVENNDEEVMRELMEEYQRRLPGYVVYSEIRPVYDICNGEGLSVIGYRGWRRKGHYNLILNVEKSEEELWNGMHKERRRNVGQAEKAALRFEEVRTEEGRSEVIALLQKTYARKRVPMADSSLFERLTVLMPKNVHFFAAYHEDKMIAGQIRLGYKNLLYAWYAGSDEEYFKLRPNDFLMWNVIRWAHEEGYKEFDFGGGGEPGKPYGVRDYKLKYGCEMRDYGRWICVKRPLQYRIGALGIKLLKRDV